MTREEQINILTEARDRALKQIDLTEGHEMGTEEFQRLIYCAEQLRWMAQPDHMPVPEIVSEEVQPEPVAPEIVSEVVQPVPTLSKEEVRDKLSTYSNKYDSLDVAAIMSDMGYGKLSDIPATKYGELLERVEAAVKEGA